MRHTMSTLIATTLALALGSAEEAKLSDEERAKRKAERETCRMQELEREAAYAARTKAEQDVIAAPYREARRLRNIRKLRT